MLTPHQMTHVRDSRLRRLVGYWQELSGCRALPRRADIDPTAIPWVLPHVWICDYIPEENSFRYRLAGEEINDIFGRNIARCMLREVVTGEKFDENNRNFLSVVEQQAIFHRSGPLYHCRHRLLAGERLILPLSEDGLSVDALLGATVAHQDPSHLDPDLDWSQQRITLTPVAGREAAQ